ncbi:hypothetical protein Ancab_008114, partial [Ancistrocladus abbreviatus]
ASVLCIEEEITKQETSRVPRKAKCLSFILSTLEAHWPLLLLYVLHSAPGCYASVVRVAVLSSPAPGCTVHARPV